MQGPPEKPGIFVQSTKAGRLAREVGLKPGDQILQCNGIVFQGLDFGQAVYHLKVRVHILRGNGIVFRGLDFGQAVYHLKVRDHILQCNGIVFQGLDFGQAVYHLKVSVHILQWARKVYAAAAEK